MLPEKFLQRMALQLQNELPAFQEALQQPAPVSVRVNAAKITTPLLYEKVPWCGDAYYLKNRPAFIFDPLWHAGTYYVQEASSMLVANAFKQLFPQPEKLNVLDLCAAPGGKSTLLLSLLSENSLLVANEVIASRNSLLRENLTRWGNANIVVTQNDPRDFQKVPQFFDCILIDAPCSGEGLFRKEPEAVNEWSEANLQLCEARQQRIVEEVLPALKPNGYIIYSTCTYNPEENEKQVASFVEKHQLKTVAIQFEKSWGMVEDEFSGLHCFPHKVKGEGFFMAVLQKISEENPQDYKVKNKLNILNTKERTYLNALLLQPELYEWIAFQENLHFFPKEKINDFNILLHALHIKMFGVVGAQLKHRDIIPQPELAFATAFNKTNYPCLTLAHETALKFLRKDVFEIEINVQGWAVMQYKNIPLGFAKINQHRINNYYPVNWRLRKASEGANFWSVLDS